MLPPPHNLDNNYGINTISQEQPPLVQPRPFEQGVFQKHGLTTGKVHLVLAKDDLVPKTFLKNQTVLSPGPNRT